MEKYDVIIVGAGPCGIYSAYELIKSKRNLKILLVDKGRDIYHRTCPILEGKIKQCPQDIYGNLDGGQLCDFAIEEMKKQGKF